MTIPSLQSNAVNPNLPLTSSPQNNTVEGQADTSSTAAKQKKSSFEEKVNFFENFLNRSNKPAKPSDEVLKNKLADIRHKASLVKSHPLPNLIKDYVADLKGFMTDVKDHAYQHQMNDDNLFEKMELIDQKLVELGDKVLEENKNELELVANLGELEGLLIDFYI